MATKEDNDPTTACESLPGSAPTAQTQPRWGFELGLLYGTAISALVWWGAFHNWFSRIPLSNGLVGVVAVLLSIKVFSVIAVLSLPWFRPILRAGVGIVASIGTGFLILFGLCFANFKI